MVQSLVSVLSPTDLSFPAGSDMRSLSVIACDSIRGIRGICSSRCCSPSVQPTLPVNCVQSFDVSGALPQA